ncbi:hypothetical protein EBS67_00470 [bacterium]|nr:hypothetical protein [bacterium]NBT60223.1 hypothetical protein [Planctomycetia bacterium]
MSQLGRCTCGTVLIKTLGRDSDDKKVEIYVCPKCVQPETVQSSDGVSKAIRTDKYGLEVLEK